MRRSQLSCSAGWAIISASCKEYESWWLISIGCWEKSLSSRTVLSKEETRFLELGLDMCRTLRCAMPAPAAIKPLVCPSSSYP